MCLSLLLHKMEQTKLFLTPRSSSNTLAGAKGWTRAAAAVSDVCSGGATLKCFPYVCSNPNPTARQRHDNDESRNTPKNSGWARGLSSLRRLCNKNTLINSALTPDEPDLIAASAQFPPRTDHTSSRQINTNTQNVSVSLSSHTDT